ncbi:MAG TPA: Uma2 family endonuclease [Chloroflexota bacterium]|nr:Uma2 family endonuclease [Chloroflexota bacterium]
MRNLAYSPQLSTPAPWAEIVPGVGPMTVDDLEAWPDDGWQYELVGGVLVRMPFSGYEASNVAARLLARLAVFVEDHELGAVTGADGGYRPDPAHPNDTELAPDVAFIRADRIPSRDSPDYRRALRLAPELAVEVVSPSQSRRALAVKAGLFLSFGTRLVWVVLPKQRQVDIFRPGDSEPSATLGIGDTLDGEDVIPGFSYPVAALFH